MESSLYTLIKKSLIQLNEQRLHTLWQQKVFTKLLGLQYKIMYKPGSDNRVADALSRRPPEQILAISTCVPQWLEAIAAAYASDAQATALITKLSTSPDSVPNFSFLNGILKFKNRVYVAQDNELQQQIVLALHASPLGDTQAFLQLTSASSNIFTSPT